MTLWLANLAAYSVQLAALVGTAALIVTLLGVQAPRATLRFWQGLFAASVVWPAWQLWSDAGAGFAAAPLLSAAFSSGVIRDAAASGAAGMQAGIVAISATAIAMALAVLATGAAVRLAWIGLGAIKLRAIRLASEPAIELLAIARPLQDEIGATADIRFSDAVGSPATIGVWRPLVLVPRRICSLPPAVQRAVLCHELLHVRRRDWLPALVEEVWCAVLWFHPAARVLASRLGLARETLVDEATIARTRDRRAYAAALLEFAADRPGPLGATALIGRRHLERRISLIAQEVSMSRSSLALRLAAAAGAVAVATMITTSSLPLSATLHAQAEPVYKPSDAGVTLPSVVHEVLPDYTAAAMQARIQGSVRMRVVVLASGDVGEVNVTQSLDKEYGLDDQAVNAMRQYKFKAGTRAGKPVHVEVEVEMTFTLK